MSLMVPKIHIYLFKCTKLVANHCMNKCLFTKSKIHRIIGTGNFLKSEMSLFNNIFSNSLRPDDAYMSVSSTVWSICLFGAKFIQWILIIHCAIRYMTQCPFIEMYLELSSAKHRPFWGDQGLYSFPKKLLTSWYFRKWDVLFIWIWCQVMLIALPGLTLLWNSLHPCDANLSQLWVRLMAYCLMTSQITSHLIVCSKVYSS